MEGMFHVIFSLGNKCSGNEWSKEGMLYIRFVIGNEWSTERTSCERTIQLRWQHHLWGYRSRTRTLTLELTRTLTLFLTVTGTKFLKENKTGQKRHRNIGQHKSYISLIPTRGGGGYKRPREARTSWRSKCLVRNVLELTEVVLVFLCDFWISGVVCTKCL